MRHSIQCLCNPAYIILSRSGLKEYTHTLKPTDKQNATRKGDTDMLSYTRSKRNRKLLNREIYFVAKLGVHNISQSRETIQLNLNIWAEKLNKFILKNAPEKKSIMKKKKHNTNYM